MSSPARPAEPVCQTSVYCRLQGHVEIHAERSPTGSVFLAVGGDAAMQLWVVDDDAAQALLRAAQYVADMFRPLPAPDSLPVLSVLPGGQS